MANRNGYYLGKKDLSGYSERVVLSGSEAMEIIKALPLEELPKYINSKSNYIKWATRQRLRGADCEMGRYLTEKYGNNDGIQQPKKK